MQFMTVCDMDDGKHADYFQTKCVFSENLQKISLCVCSPLSPVCVCVNLHVYAISRKGISPEDTWPTDCAAGKKKTD